jgi:hypothetical protein
MTNASEFRVALPHLLRYPINDVTAAAYTGVWSIASYHLSKAYQQVMTAAWSFLSWRAAVSDSSRCSRRTSIH